VGVGFLLFALAVKYFKVFEAHTPVANGDQTSEPVSVPVEVG
jgi:hypothetical protein